MIDLVFILGSGSINQNIELRYSLKSVERFMTGYRNIYIIGENPGFEGNFIHIPFPDDGNNKQDNIRRKLSIACQTSDISDEFLMMNDDYMLLKPVSAIDIPFYYYGNLSMTYRRKRKPGHYKRSLQNTLMELTYRDLPYKNFDVHVPMRIEKAKFLDIMGGYNWQTKDGYVVKSIYCNTQEIEGRPMDDCNINIVCQTRAEILELIGNRFMFSIGDTGLNDVMLAFLAEIYSDVSEVSET